jgi:uncharacterized YccA/Bax inhibitor family protein
MANPALNEKTFAPERLRTIDPSAVGAGRITDGPLTGEQQWRTQMTLDGVVMRAGVLFPLLAVAGWFGWQSVQRTELGVTLPGWLLFALLGAVGVAIATIFKPKFARITAPIYAVLEGLVLGAISALYNARYQGIVLQAVLLTGAVFAIMLGLYATRIVRVTDRLRRGIIAATLAIVVVYVISIVMNIFGANVPFIHESSPIGILFSLAVVGVASFNLLLDFDLIEKGVQSGAPKWMEWYAAFGLMLTLVWLYLELLRLLSKLRSR